MKTPKSIWNTAKGEAVRTRKHGAIVRSKIGETTLTKLVLNSQTRAALSSTSTKKFATKSCRHAFQKSVCSRALLFLLPVQMFLPCGDCIRRLENAPPPATCKLSVKIISTVNSSRLHLKTKLVTMWISFILLPKKQDIHNYIFLLWTIAFPTIHTSIYVARSTNIHGNTFDPWQALKQWTATKPHCRLEHLLCG